MERELKLRLDPGLAAGFGASAALAGTRPDRRRMVATYFDTPSGELAAARLGLRLRREGGRWRQTLKAGGAAATGLHERPEWDFPAAANRLDLSRFAGTPLAGLDDAASLHARLAPRFTVDMARTRWRLAPVTGSVLEVALDEGAVRADGREERFCEVEIECLEGGPEAAFDLAQALAAATPLLPTTVTKAARGVRLAEGRPWTSAKARAPALAPTATIDEGARGIVAAALAHWHANQEGLLAEEDPELVHQARIALRRLRSALATFREAVEPERAAAWRRALGEVAASLGEARDWDVFGTEMLPRLLAVGATTAVRPFDEEAVARRRREAREAARIAVGAGAFGATLLAIARWVAIPESTAEVPGALAPFASRLLRKRHRRLMRDSEHLARVTPEERHRVRIDAKRLRYSADAMAGLFDAERASEYVSALADLQDTLGQANDAITALALLEGARPEPAFEAFARGWLCAHAAPDPDHLALLRQRLADAPKFWKPGGP